MSRDDLGRKSKRQMPEDMARIQKIQRQLGYWIRAPPMTGRLQPQNWDFV
jgi:hypothetical protein